MPIAVQLIDFSIYIGHCVGVKHTITSLIGYYPHQQRQSKGMLIEGVPMADVSNGLRQSQQHQYFRKGGGGTSPLHENCSVGERLYHQGHLCNHRNCAANNPDYNVRTALPPKKFLVAKKHAYGGLEEKGGEKTRTKSSNSATTTSSDQHSDRNNALRSLTNSVLTTGIGKARSNRTTAVPTTANGKARSNGMQQSRLTRDTSSSDGKKVVAERRGRPTSRLSNSGLSYSLTRRSSVTSESLQSEAQTSRLSNVTSPLPSQATEQSSQRWEDSASPESSITSNRISQKVISTRIGDEEKEAHDVAEGATAASSPTASVGSNHDTQISGLKEAAVTVVEQGEIVEESTANFGNLLSSPDISENSYSNHNLHMETTCESPSLSVDSGPTTVSEFISPLAQSASFAPRTPESSSPTTTSMSDMSSSTLRKSPEGQVEVSYDSSSPSVASSRPTTSEPLTSLVTSVKSGPPRHSDTSHRRSSLPTPPPSSATNIARKFINNLKDSASVGSPRPSSSSPGSSANRPSRVSRNSVSPTLADLNLPSRVSSNSVSPTLVDSSPAPASASRLAKKFITDLQAKPVARKPSTKGVRSIELRGGKAKSYSTTTVSSWNVTTTTVETTLSLSGGTPDKNVDFGLPASGPGEQISTKIPDESSMRESQPGAAGSNHSTVDSKPPNRAPALVKCVKNVKDFEGRHSESETVSVKFVKNAKSLEELRSEREIVHLKHGEVAERRLSEEYLTNHALEKKISDKDHRVKVLVHAFETLATLSDAEVPGGEGGPLNPQLVHESSSATPVAV